MFTTVLENINGTIYNSPFVCMVNYTIYKCIPIDEIPSDWISYKVLFPQIKKIYKVNNPISDDNILLIIQNKIKIQKMYSCQKINSVSDI